jgi:hypothetical protein
MLENASDDSSLFFKLVAYESEWNEKYWFYGEKIIFVYRIIY